MLNRLDHVNLRTAHLADMIRWYEDVLGMTNGDRPPFPFGGAWLYAGEHAVVHLVEHRTQPEAREPAIEHFAITASGLDEFLNHIEQRGVEYQCAVVPGFEIIQVNIHDPDGNHIHIDFDPSEHKALANRGLA
ncbi:MAG: VOC family protein [Geminicoccaceae bacterium]|nr:VOC family protein [Geminicoccaceae bacterium]MCB9944220.1 VOC family protein [Geminicoccaceae bacterium]